ncbi:hypothetical protein, partial [Klebsiella pneumoniae]|uniref:hypothetical protein n=1 Tax=Klebsiella pneumoniae TaxID=573 RepID=UPI0025A21B8D
ARCARAGRHVCAVGHVAATSASVQRAAECAYAVSGAHRRFLVWQRRAAAGSCAQRLLIDPIGRVAVAHGGLSSPARALRRFQVG